jgi:RNA polymerase sigma factor (sigma-70 family)
MTTTDLVQKAIAGDERAWAGIVNRYGNVVRAATYGFRFDDDTREEVAQLTWLKLLDHISTVREPEKLGGWLAITANRVCLEVVRGRARVQPRDDLESDRDSGAPELDTALIRDETIRDVAEALDRLDAPCRRLLRLLTADPPIPYKNIIEILDMPIGSIGPTRQRCLEKLARHPSIARLIDSSSSASDENGRA